MAGLDRHLADVADGFALFTKSNVTERIESALDLIAPALRQQRPLLEHGNGGWAADALNIFGGVVGRIALERGALNVICLSANVAVMTAWANDYDFESVFAWQVEAYGGNGGVSLCIARSGNSKDVIKAWERARQMDIQTTGMSGKGGRQMALLCNVLPDVPSNSTPRVQEMHGLVYRYLCGRIESALLNSQD